MVYIYKKITIIGLCERDEKYILYNRNLDGVTRVTLAGRELVAAVKQSVDSTYLFPLLL